MIPSTFLGPLLCNMVHGTLYLFLSIEEDKEKLDVCLVTDSYTVDA